MNYVVELHKPSTTLVRELFNFHNGSDFTAEQLYADGPPQVLSDGLYNTSQRMIVNDPELGPILPWATIKYNRIDIATLFSVVEIKLREVDIKADGTYDHALVLGEIARKYGLDNSEGKFVIKDVNGQESLVATADNPAFVGHSPLVVELSLDSRISLKVLNGFYALLGPFGPGGTDITFGDAELGFINTVPSNELVTGTQLAHLVGLTVGTPIYENNDVNWIKYTYKGKICYVAQKPIRHSVSYNDLLAVGVAGATPKIVVIGEDVFRVRLMHGVGDSELGYSSPGTDNPATHGSEWNQVMYRLSADTVSTASEQPYDPWLTLSNGELGTGYWSHIEGSVVGHPYPALYRGYGSIAGNSSNTLAYKATTVAWRPVLEIVDKSLIWMSAEITRIRSTFLYKPGALTTQSEDPIINTLMAAFDNYTYVDALLNPYGTDSVDPELMVVPCIPEGEFCDSIITPTVFDLSNDEPTHDLYVIAPVAVTYTYYQPSIDLTVSESVPYIPGVISLTEADIITPSTFTGTEVYDLDAISRPYNPLISSWFFLPVELELSADVEGEITQVSQLLYATSDFLQHPTEPTYVSNEDTP
jgi:hypothetical protein